MAKDMKELNNKERKELDLFLRSIDNDSKEHYTIRFSLCDLWNRNNNRNFMFPTYQPNYANLDIRITTKTINIKPIIIKDSNGADILSYNTYSK